MGSVLIQKYKALSQTFKATIWYTACNIIQKIAAFLLIPFLTRTMNTNEYGMYAVFLSWTDIIEILATLRIYSNGYVAGIIKNNNDEKSYTCSTQFISLIMILLNFSVFLLLSEPITKAINIDRSLVYYMYLSFLATSCIGIWSSRQRVNNKYKLMVFVTVFYGVLAPAASIVAAYIFEDKLKAVIMTRVIVQFVVAIQFMLINLIGKDAKIKIKYCKEALVYNIPLIPYYLSMVVLNSSDRIMIKEIIGDTEAGIYSVAYSVAMAVFVLVGALNMSLQPWIFTRLKNNTIEGSSKTITIATAIIAMINTGVLIVSPEIIRIAASPEYADAIWTMPPIIISLLVMFIYQQILNIHFYFGNNKIVFLSSVFAAMVNVILNYFCVTYFGYIAAGYTTLVSYMLIAVLYYITMKRIAVKNCVNYKEIINMPALLGIVIAFICITAVAMILFSYPIIRYLLLLLIFSGAFVGRKRLFKFVKNLKV